ncbi:MAG: hypothetical protein WBQ23_08360 [Bacteroidota bacterium]
MNTTIQFLRDPKYQDTVILFILAPAGIQYEPSEIGKNLFGNDSWTYEPLLIDGLAPKATFRYSDISFHWTDFLDLAFRHVDHGLFYVPHKKTFKEIGKESLLQQNPDLYSFSFHKFVCESRKGLPQPPTKETPVFALSGASLQAAEPSNGSSENAAGKYESDSATAADSRSAAEKLIETRATLQALLDTGWSANAVSKNTGITAMTIGSIKNGKSAQVSSRVYSAIMKMRTDADAGRIAPKSRGTAGAAAADRGQVNPASSAQTNRPAAYPPPSRTTGSAASAASEETGSLLKNQYVAVDARQLEAMIDRLSKLFTDAIGDLKEIRRQVSK